MSEQLQGAVLLLADPSPLLRRRVLLDLFQRPPDDSEVHELEALLPGDPLAAAVLDLQQPDGSWGEPLATARALMRLGYLGFGPSDPAVQRAAEYLFECQRADGAWPLPARREAGAEDDLDPGANQREGYAMMPLQTALPLRGLAACGLAEDPRAARAYEWLLAQRLQDGAWPTGLANSGVYGYVAGYRRMPHSRWGCRSNTTGALLCLALHPTLCRAPEARRALDLLLGRETREEYALGFEVARLLGAEAAHGFTTFYARFDLAMLLDLCWRVGAALDDERVAGLVRFVHGLRGELGLWEYRRRPQIARWLTFDLLRSLSRLVPAGSDWLTLEPRTPFQTYGRKAKRF